MVKKQKYYVVWKGLKPGIYQRWEECKKQINGYPEARYKSFDNRELAELAFGDTHVNYYQSVETTKGIEKPVQRIPPEAMAAIAVDAACAGNPGKMEYRGMFVETRQEIFKSKVYPNGTNNIGEFLAIVHALAWLEQKKLQYPVYSDSKIAIQWVKAGKCRTKLVQSTVNQELFELIQRAENWLRNHRITVSVRKWDTENWGEIVADYQRK